MQGGSTVALSHAHSLTVPTSWLSPVVRRAESGEEGAASVRSRLERLWQEEASTSSPFDTLPAAAPPSPSPGSHSTPSGVIAVAVGEAGAAAGVAAAPPTLEVLQARLTEAVEIRGLLQRNSEVGVAGGAGPGHASDSTTTQIADAWPRCVSQSTTPALP